jgi:putative redox protein
MVNISVSYEGDLHCRLEHGPSGDMLLTDAPKDNQGKGEHFSPTDLVAAALGSCSLTTMAIYAKRHNKELGPMSLKIQKEMTTEPPRRIAKLSVQIQMPQGLSAEERPAYERVATSCPVHKSLHPDVQVVTSFTYTD